MFIIKIIKLPLLLCITVVVSGCPVSATRSATKSFQTLEDNKNSKSNLEYQPSDLSSDPLLMPVVPSFALSEDPIPRGSILTDQDIPLSSSTSKRTDANRQFSVMPNLIRSPSSLLSQNKKNVNDLDLKKPELTEPELAEPELTEPELTEPELTEPELAEPELTEPELTEPELAEPELTEPELAEPELAEPELAEPEFTEPEFTEPELTEPELTEPELTEPELTEPELTEPELTEPELAEPELTEPELAEPELTEPELAEPELTDSFNEENQKEDEDQQETTVAEIITKFPSSQLRSCILRQRKETISELTHLICSSKGISTIDGLEYLTALKKIDFSNNEIKSFDFSMSNYTSSLERIDLSNNQLKGTLNLDKHPKLRFADVSHNEIDQVYFGVAGHKTKIGELHLQGNKISRILDLSHHPKLNILDASDNNLKYVYFGEIGHKTELMWLNLSNNSISQKIELEQHPDIRNVKTHGNPNLTITYTKSKKLYDLSVDGAFLKDIDNLRWYTDLPSLYKLELVGVESDDLNIFGQACRNNHVIKRLKSIRFTRTDFKNSTLDLAGCDFLERLHFKHSNNLKDIRLASKYKPTFSGKYRLCISVINAKSGYFSEGKINLKRLLKKNKSKDVDACD